MRDPRTLTLLQSLEHTAQTQPTRGIRTYNDTYQPELMTFAELVVKAQGIAANLQARGFQPGERVAIILMSPADFLPAFYGVQYAGGIPVPMYGPTSMNRLGGYLEVASHILQAAQARFLITEGQLTTFGAPLVSMIPNLEAIIDISETAGDAGAWKSVDVKPEDVAFIQFTSGSTSKPKGVRLTHKCLQNNVYVIRRFGVGLNDDDIPVSWLPLYHDMGLIGFHFTPMVQGITINYMTPVQFIMRPIFWLKLITEMRSTISFSPNFGYGYAAKRVKDADLEGLDLSSWRIAGCGAEPIKVDTLRSFFDRFAPVGFNRRVLVPCYGLAEFSLAATFTPMTRGLVVDTVDAEKLADEHKAVPVAPGQGVEFVGCGFAVPGHTVEIVDANGFPLPERTVGEIRLRGPSRAQGYEGIPEGTGAFRDGYLYTGDLGYLSGCELFVCGRDKEIIKSRGRTYYPQDIEWAAAQVTGVRFGAVAAFGVPSDEGTEEVVVVVEKATNADMDDKKLQRAVIREVGDSAGILVDRVVVGPKGTITKTSSGKVQRTKVRQLFLEGRIGDEGREEALLNQFWGKLFSAEDKEG